MCENPSKQSSKCSSISRVGVMEGSENSELTQFKGMEGGQKMSFRVAGEALSAMKEGSQSTADIESPRVVIQASNQVNAAA